MAADVPSDTALLQANSHDAFIIQATQALDASFSENYPQDWEFYYVVKDYLGFIKLLLARRDDNTDVNKVSDFVNTLLVVLRSGSRNIYEFTPTILFDMYFTDFENEINQHIAKYNITLAKIDGKITITPKIPKRKRSISDEIPVKNSFAPLADENPEGMMDESPSTPTKTTDSVNVPAETSEVNTKKKGKPYQLFFEINSNCKNILQQLHHLSKHITTKYVKNQIQVTTDCLDSFRMIQRYLNENKIPARYLDLKSDRPKKFIVRGLPVITELEDIAEALRLAQIEPLKIAYLTNRRTKQPMPLFIVTVRPSPAVDNICEIKQINYLSVQFEPYNSTGFAQCYRCQEYGHSSLTCNLTPRCLKCSEPHRASLCTATPDNFKCANCGEKHTANYKGCPMHPSNRQNRQRSRSRSRQRKNFVPAPNPNFNPWQRSEFPPLAPNEQNHTTDPTPTECQKTVTTNESLPTSSKTPTQAESEIASKPRHVRKSSIKTKQNSEKNEPKKTPTFNDRNEKPKQTNKDRQSNNENASISDIYKTIIELTKIFNINDIFKLFKEITRIMKEQEDPIQKLLMILEIIANYFGDPQHG